MPKILRFILNLKRKARLQAIGEKKKLKQEFLCVNVAEKVKGHFPSIPLQTHHTASKFKAQIFCYEVVCQPLLRKKMTLHSKEQIGRIHTSIKHSLLEQI